MTSRLSDFKQYSNAGLAYLETSRHGHDTEEEEVDDSQNEAVVKIGA